MIAIAALGILAWIAIETYPRILKSGSRAKLESDVVALNQSVRLYLANGGSLDGVTNPQSVINKLKTTRAVKQAATHVGFNGSVIDSRLAAKMVIDPKSSDLRARWNANLQMFELTQSGDGITEFVLDASTAPLADVEESREASFLQFHSEDGWIWAYDDESSPSLKTGPTKIPLSPQPLSLTPGFVPEAKPLSPPLVKTPLRPPTLSIAPGSYAPSQFDLALKLKNPNTGIKSWIKYSLNGGRFYQYTGTLFLAPNTAVAAYIEADPDLYYTSSQIAGLFTALPATELLAPIIEASDVQFVWNTKEKISVTIQDQNPPSISSLEYHLGDENWTAYSKPFHLSINDHLGGVTITARALPRSSDYLTSPATETAVNGPATAGLLWEAALFWHWSGPSYHHRANSYVPGQTDTIKAYLKGAKDKKAKPQAAASKGKENNARRSN